MLDYRLNIVVPTTELLQFLSEGPEKFINTAKIQRNVDLSHGNNKVQF